MEITARINGGYPILDLAGKLTFGPATMKLRNAIRDSAESNPRRIALNLRDVTFIDSCGLGELVSSRDYVKSSGGNLVLFNLPDRVMSLMILTRIETAFDVFKDEVLAIADAQPEKTWSQMNR